MDKPDSWFIEWRNARYSLARHLIQEQILGSSGGNVLWQVGGPKSFKVFLPKHIKGVSWFDWSAKVDY